MAELSDRQMGEIVRKQLADGLARINQSQLPGRVQKGRAGLGRGETPLFWLNASKEEQRAMVVAEVTRTEQERLNIKAVSQNRQGGWMSWEGMTDRSMSWSDMWKITQARLSFLIRSTYDTLPCPRNLH